MKKYTLKALKKYPQEVWAAKPGDGQEVSIECILDIEENIDSTEGRDSYVVYYGHHFYIMDADEFEATFCEAKE